MKCYNCKKENIEQGNVFLVNSPDVANALVFTCNECSKSNDHAIVKCNTCEKTVDAGSQGSKEGGYIEDILNENYVVYCVKCAIEKLTGALEKKYIIKESKKIFKFLKECKNCLKILITLQSLYDKIKNKYPYVDLCIYKKKNKIVVCPFDSDAEDEVSDMINKTLQGE
jgi:hypothetical protein